MVVHPRRKDRKHHTPAHECCHERTLAGSPCRCQTVAPLMADTAPSRASAGTSRSSSVHEAVTLLAADEDAKVLAGGQSLLPLLALRLARPSTLVDITRLQLRGAEILERSPYLDGRVLRVGALTRQRQLEVDPAVASAVPLVTAAVGHVGHPATRNRGTLGGSL